MSRKKSLADVWRQTEKTASCWLFSGNIDSDGYGRLGRQGKVHRVVYLACVGPIPEGHVIRHKCDVRNCVNPEHLETGTTQDNTNDRHMRGRTHRMRSEDMWDAKLSVEDVREIWRVHLSGGFMQKEIALVYGVHKTTINDILKKRRWKAVAKEFTC